MLLSGKVRREEEVTVIKEVMGKHFKQCPLEPDQIFHLSGHDSSSVLSKLQDFVHSTLSDSVAVSSSVSGFQHMVWTAPLRRMAVLVGYAIDYSEPVLLVGDSG